MRTRFRVSVLIWAMGVPACSIEDEHPLSEMPPASAVSPGTAGTPAPSAAVTNPVEGATEPEPGADTPPLNPTPVAAEDMEPPLPEPASSEQPTPAGEPEAFPEPEPTSAVEPEPTPTSEPEPTSSTDSGASEPVTPMFDGGSSEPPPDAAGMTPEPVPAPIDGLLWPIACIPEDTCLDIGYPDADGDGLAFDCSSPGYQSHEGTDIPVTWEQMDSGIDVYAAADGEVLWAFDGKYDRCPDAAEPDCSQPESTEAGEADGVQVCTELGPYCNDGGVGQCFWCFWGGNVIVIRHFDTEGVFATRYDHLKRGSVAVARGDRVTAGQKIAEVGSAGNSTGPHLHFEVWNTGYYQLTEPWVGECGPNTNQVLWEFDPPWSTQ